MHLLQHKAWTVFHTEDQEDGVIARIETEGACIDGNQVSVISLVNLMLCAEGTIC